MNRSYILITLWLTLLSCQQKPTLSDADGNVYASKKFGKTLWMTENLRVTHDRSGAEISYFFPNEDSINVAAYGLFYDYETACKVCPDGWKLPSNQDWEALLSHFSWDASVLKDTGFWDKESNTNTSSFSARPAGYGNTEHPNKFQHSSIFWSSTREDDHFIWTYIFEEARDSVRTASQHPTYGFSVRCIKESAEK